MNKLFGKLFLSFMLIITLIMAALMVTFTLVYSRSYEEQVISANDEKAAYIAQSLYSFMHVAYKTVEELSYNSDVISMDTERQTPVFVSSLERNDYFELLYAQGMDGMQTGRSSGNLGNRKERWWFIQMEQTQKPFVSESYYSVGTNMPCASVFVPIFDKTSVAAESEMIGIMAGDIKLSALHDLVAENADTEAGSWSFILDGKGVVVAHPDSTYQEELYNYLTLTRTVTVKDEHGVPIQDAAGNITEEQSFYISESYRAAIDDMIHGNINSSRFEEDGGTIYLSYRPVEMDGFSDPWYVLAVQDGDIAMRTRNTVIFLIAVSALIIIVTAVLLVLFAARNITTVVKMEAMETRLEKEKAQASERAKSEFLAAMSHEIRTPLNAIIGITQIQLLKDDISGEYSDIFEHINNSGNTLLGLINDILDMSKIETGKLELHNARYDVPSMINDAVQLNIVRIGTKPIKFILDVDENLPSALFGDELRLKQVLSNLLSNAIKYTEKGEIKLTVRIASDDNADEPAESEANDNNTGNIRILFEVSDTGQGMKEEDCKLLFTEYKRFNAEANRTTEGTGLGLSITKKIVEMMNGSISVQSRYGEGSVFTVIVMQELADKTPIGAEIAESFRKLVYTDTKARNRRNKVRTPMPYGSVLIVDDSASNLYVAAGLLAPYQLNIDTAESGFSAIEKISKGAVYDVIFMDHMMPQMDGIETTRRLREMNYSGTIVALTANALVGNDVMFSENGFDGFIPKPIDIRRLDEILCRFIRDRHIQEDNEQITDRSTQLQNVLPQDNQLNPMLLKIFVREARTAAVTLHECVCDSNISLFTSTVHAMKSALANVGEQKLSEMAAGLEAAGLGGDESYIVSNADNFIEEIKRLADKIENEEKQNNIPETESQAEETGDTGFLTEQLNVVKTACAEYDDTKAYVALDRLSKMNWKKDVTDTLENIKNALYLDSDFEKAGMLTEKLSDETETLQEGSTDL